MDWSIVGILFCAGILGGVINAVAGGATLVTFPAMLAAGLPPVMANASNAVAIAPGHLLAAVAGRETLPAFDRRMAISLGLAVLGGACGALLLLVLPDHIFVLPVPALIGFATLLFAVAPRMAAWTRGAEGSSIVAMAALAASSIYGGFFGAGLGVILTAVLSLSWPADIRKVKVLKNLLATAVSLAAVTIFVVQGAVRWPETCLMLGGALIGGYAGGHLIRILPGELVRMLVIAAGFAMTAYYAWRYWF